MTSVQTMVRDLATDCLRSPDPELRVLAARALEELDERGAAMTRSPFWTVEDENGDPVVVTLDEIEAASRAELLKRAILDVDYGGIADGLAGHDVHVDAVDRLGDTFSEAEYAAALDAAGYDSRATGAELTTEPKPNVKRGEPRIEHDPDPEVHHETLNVIREMRLISEPGDDGVADQEVYDEARRIARRRLGR